MHECFNCGNDCYCEGDDLTEDPQPDTCTCPCFEDDDWPFRDGDPDVTDAPEWMPGS
jgi:hypothetical protein